MTGVDHICVCSAVLYYKDITCIATQAQLASANTILLITWTDSVQMNLQHMLSLVNHQMQLPCQTQNIPFALWRLRVMLPISLTRLSQDYLQIDEQT